MQVGPGFLDINQMRTTWGYDVVDGNIDRTWINPIHNKKAYQQNDLACLHRELK
jgi:hypothetical protein